MDDILLNLESLADEMPEVPAYAATLPRMRDFLPWHRPRKQYVRKYQWCEEIWRMLDDSPLTDGTLKYMGLPGVDLLDLRYFHNAICETRNIKLRFLGFIESAKPTNDAQTEFNVSLDEVRRLPRVDPMSHVIGDDFALVAKEDSFAFRKARELGPFDVINLDLCDGFGAQAPGGLDQTYYDAVNSLLTLQSRYKNPWLLLLTTRADRANVNPEVLQKLLDKYINNLTNSAPFREASLESFDIGTKDALCAAANTAEGLLAVFLTGLCKWFLGLALKQRPPTAVKLLSVIGYRVKVDAEHEDLISLALRFKPTHLPPSDPLGLASHQGVAPDEYQLATSALKQVAKREDADKRLIDDAGLNQEMIDATSSLLGLARYDVDAYRAWVQQV